jgi:hypothetical protein
MLFLMMMMMDYKVPCVCDVLSHMYRMDLNHKSNTAFEWDNYSKSEVHDEWQPVDWQEDIKGHPCYTPGVGVWVWVWV